MNTKTKSTRLILAAALLMSVVAPAASASAIAAPIPSGQCNGIEDASCGTCWIYVAGTCIVSSGRTCTVYVHPDCMVG